MADELVSSPAADGQSADKVVCTSGGKIQVNDTKLADLTPAQQAILLVWGKFEANDVNYRQSDLAKVTDSSQSYPSKLLSNDYPQLKQEIQNEIIDRGVENVLLSELSLQGILTLQDKGYLDSIVSNPGNLLSRKSTQAGGISSTTEDSPATPDSEQQSSDSSSSSEPTGVDRPTTAPEAKPMSASPETEPQQSPQPSQTPPKDTTESQPTAATDDTGTTPASDSQAPSSKTVSQPSTDTSSGDTQTDTTGQQPSTQADAVPSAPDHDQSSTEQQAQTTARRSRSSQPDSDRTQVQNNTEIEVTDPHQEGSNTNNNTPADPDSTPESQQHAASTSQETTQTHVDGMAELTQLRDFINMQKDMIENEVERSGDPAQQARLLSLLDELSSRIETTVEAFEQGPKSSD